MPAFGNILVFVIVHTHTLKFVSSLFSVCLEFVEIRSHTFLFTQYVCHLADRFAELNSNTMFVGSTTTVRYFFNGIRPTKLWPLLNG